MKFVMSHVTDKQTYGRMVRFLGAVVQNAHAVKKKTQKAKNFKNQFGIKIPDMPRGYSVRLQEMLCQVLVLLQR